MPPQQRKPLRASAETEQKRLAQEALATVGERGKQQMAPTRTLPGSQQEREQEEYGEKLGAYGFKPIPEAAPQRRQRRGSEQSSPPTDPRDRIFAELMAKLQYAPETGNRVAPIVDINQLAGLSQSQQEAGQSLNVQGYAAMPDTGLQALTVPESGIPFSSIPPHITAQMGPYLQGRTAIGWPDQAALTPEELALMIQLQTAQPPAIQLSPIDRAALMGIVRPGQGRI